MTKIRMANGDAFEAEEPLNQVLDHISKAKKANRPLVGLKQAHTETEDRLVWLNLDQISSVR